MKRFNVTLHDGYTMRLYYQSLSDCQQVYPDAIIKENNDKSYIEYIEKIKQKSIETLFDYRGREIWKIPYNNSFVLYKQYIYDNAYIDGCDYQRHDNIQYTTPIMWNMSNPMTFYEDFIVDEHIELPIEIISQNDIKKLKAKKFWNKNNMAFWHDDNGYFYYADKTDLRQDKESKQEYEQSHDCKDAIEVKYGTEKAFMTYRWFSNEDEFNSFWKEHLLNHNPAFGTLGYEIVKRGYTLKPIADRKVIFRLPYFDVDKEYKLNDCPRELARSWCKLMQGYRQFADWRDNFDWVEELIKMWVNK